MKQSNKNRGFSVMELVLVIGIISIITAFTLPNLFSRKSVTELNNTVNQISVTLREAQSRAISQSGGFDWGVRFDNGTPSYFAMFSTQNYSSSTRALYTTLPQGIGYTTSTLDIGSSTDVVFGQITGRPNRSLYLDLYLTRNPQITLAVNVSISGQVTVLTKEILTASLYGSIQDILELAKAAQQNSIDGVNNSVWGVHFQNPTGAVPYAELFYGTYSPAAVTKHLDLLPGVDYDPSSIPEGSSVDVTFSSNGNPSKTVTITTHLISYPTISTFVQIDRSGICVEGSCGSSGSPSQGGGGGGTGGGGTGGGGTGGGGTGGGGTGGGGCFTFNTLVDTPSGPRAIGTLGVGDTVYAYDETTGETVQSQVTRVFVHTDRSYGVVTFSDGTSLEVTSVHRFYNPLTKQFLPIGEMQIGDSVLGGIGPAARPITIRSMEFTSGLGTVYNIEVNRYHTYYVNGILVHNKKVPILP